MNTNKMHPALLALLTFIGTMAGTLGLSYLLDLVTGQFFLFTDPLILISSGIVALIPAITVFLHANERNKHHTV